jgi:hypothetical protein
MALPRTHRRTDRGFALVPTLLLLVLLFGLGAGALLVSGSDLRSTAHYRTGNEAFFAAEAGVLHALSTMNTRGVQSFQTMANSTNWQALYGSAVKTIPNYSQFSYQVALVPDATNPNNAGSISVTGFAPLQAKRSLQLALARANTGGSPGAIYLAADALDNIEFKGDKFAVDGNDHTVLGALNGGGPQKPGISTRNDGVTGQAVQELNSAQKDNVKGLGYVPPLGSTLATPSVLTTGGPSIGDLDTIMQTVLSNVGASAVTTSESNFNGNDTFGTLAVPRVTHLTGSDVKLNGNATGAGILIVDGSLVVNGTLDFVGWIVVRGDTIINTVGDPDNETFVLGDATIRGALWTGHLRVEVGGSAIIDYCDACMTLADTTGAGQIGNVPRPMTVVSWQEV